MKKVVLGILCLALALGASPAQAASVSLLAMSGKKLPKRYGALELVCNYSSGKPVLGVLRLSKFKKLTLAQARSISSKVRNTVCPKKCTPTAKNKSITVSEIGTVSINLGKDNCKLPLKFVRVTDAKHGEQVAFGSILTYSPDKHFRGRDSIRYRTSNGMKRSSSAGTITINVVAKAAEFAGDPTSLAPYREQLTASEVRGFLKRVALGGDDSLYQIGINQGRAALVEAVLTRRAPQSVEGVANARADVVSWDYGSNYWDVVGGRRMWAPWSARVAWEYEVLHGDPLFALASMHLHDQVATNLNASTQVSQVGLVWPIKDHYLKVRDLGLGSYADFLKLMNYDASMGWWLGNIENFYGLNSRTGVQQAGNFNYGREVLERFTLGRFDPYTGSDNYTPEDVTASARILSGFFSWFPTYDSNWGGYKNWNSSAQYPQGFAGMGIKWDTAQAFNGPVRIFSTASGSYANREFIPGGGASSVQRTNPVADSYMNMLLFEHPATARHMAYTLFGRYAIPNPDERIVDELAEQLRTTNYDVSAFLRRVLNSSAFFTAESMDGCIKSPMEHIAYVTRILGFPMQSLHAQRLFSDAVIGGGFAMFEPGNVFGWQMCGDLLEPGVTNHGENWIKYQGILNRGRALYDLIIHEQQSGDVWGTFPAFGSGVEPGEEMDIRSKIYGDWDNPSAEAVVARAAEKFSLQLSSEEKNVLVSYLNGAGAAGEGGWNPTNVALVKARLSGLTWILAMHPKTIL